MRVNTKSMEEKIMLLYERDRRVADDDKLLISYIWRKEGWNEARSLYSNLCNVSSPETIRRTRQKMISDGKIVPSSSISKARYNDSLLARKDLGY